MKWVSKNNEASLENFELWEGEKKLAAVSFSKYTRFARIVSNMDKRIFSFERRGFLSAKEIIRNEYGIKMGEVEETKPGAGKGHVELDGKKYVYVFDKNHSGKMTLYDDLMHTSLLHCSFNTNSFSKTSSPIDTRFSSLLLVLCWYSFQNHNMAASEAFA